MAGGESNIVGGANYITIDPGSIQTYAWGMDITTSTTKTKKTMKKFYRVKKDTPAWEVGAILENKCNGGSGYQSVNELFNKEWTKDDYYESGSIVENASEYFERVYPVNLLSKTVYKLKEEAREFFSKEHTA